MLLMMIIVYLCVFLSVAFVTLLERKCLGYVHLRKGPNKVAFIGLGQPFADAGKLFMKEFMLLSKTAGLVYYISPMLMLLIMMCIWMSYPFYDIDFSFNIFFFFCCVAIGVYPLIVAGWSSNSKYSILGSMRAVAQAVSYEVSLILVVLSMLMLVGLYCYEGVLGVSVYVSLGYLLWPIFFLLLIMLIAELGRTPFDFIEGESELVSGFNVEFGSGLFALIFIAEYGNIIFMSSVMMMFFFGGVYNFIDSVLRICLLSCLIIFVRGELPRTRYDKLMALAWEVCLPLSLSLFGIFMLIFSLGLFT
uniref:NADH-ubiquinone oxidoreductase chain 1 n=1 Tax=Echinoderes svetlanae TaxID=1912903 RepID=A0A1I9VTU2_9BILA|nr:NADH dehydrogenase subunit 1 [Echinoderes svetlanae]APA17415.1 NADH dehydrogenase subunit 1 [Echinoderes svetlanae]